MAKKKAKKKTTPKTTKKAVKKKKKQTTKERLDCHAATLERLVKEAGRLNTQIGRNTSYGTKLFEAITRKNADGANIKEQLDARDKQMTALTNAHDTLECNAIDTDRKIVMLTGNVREALEMCEKTKNWVGTLERHITRLGTRVNIKALEPDADATIRTLVEQVAALQIAVTAQAEQLQAAESPDADGKRTITLTY